MSQGFQRVRPSKISTPTWAPPEVVPTELGGGRRLRDAWPPAPEVETVSTNVLRIWRNRQKKTKMCANQGPPNEGPDPEASNQPYQQPSPRASGGPRARLGPRGGRTWCRTWGWGHRLADLCALVAATGGWGDCDYDTTTTTVS
jgi:hypothetical protein